MLAISDKLQTHRHWGWTPAEKVTVMQLIALIVILGGALLFLDGILPEGTVVVAACVMLQIQLAWMLMSWRWLGQELFSPYGLFVVAVFVFNAGQTSLELVGLNMGGLLGGEFSQHLVIRTLLFVLYGLSALHLGAIAAVAGSDIHYSIAAARESEPRLRKVALGLFLVAAVPSVLLWKHALALVAQGGYLALYQADLATGMGASSTILSGFLVPSGFLLLAGSANRRSLRLAACAIVGSFVLVHLLIGLRGHAVAVLAAFSWVWHRAVRPLPLARVLATGAVFAILILPAIGVTRGSAAKDRMSLSQFAESYAGIQNPAIYTLHEMGNSMITSAYTMQVVPERHPYELGSSYGYALFSLVPNLFWQVHPAAEHSPSKWLVNAVEPERARVSGGLGYSLLAESYLNFGWLGAGTMIGLIGFAVGRLSRWARLASTPAPIAFAGLQLAPLLIYARAETGEVIRGLAWYALIPYLLVSFSVQKKDLPAREITSS